MTKTLKITDEQNARKKIFELDLEPLKVKLQSKSEGPGWSLEKCDAVEVQYKRFLILCFKYENIGLVPSVDIDDFWHTHILDTRKYFDDCDQIFGRYLHHFPYLGLRGVEDEKNLRAKADETAKLYLAEFGAEYYAANSSGMCKGCSSCGERGVDAGWQFEARPYPVRNQTAFA